MRLWSRRLLFTVLAPTCCHAGERHDAAKAANPVRLARRSSAPQPCTHIRSLPISACVPCPPAANFAQITGPPRQNVIKVSDSAWSERWGMAATALDYSAEEELETGRTARIFVIGGDTYDDQHGGGGFMNDVYSMTKPTWQRYLHPLEKNKRGDAQPRLVSKAEWTQVGDAHRAGRSAADHKALIGLPCARSVSCVGDKRTHSKPQSALLVLDLLFGRERTMARQESR